MGLRNQAKGMARTLIAVAALASTVLIVAQSAPPHPALPAARPRAIRAIDDPSTQTHWLLVRIAGSRGGPGQLVLAMGRDDRSVTRDRRPDQAQGIAAPRSVVIRGGDRLIVEETTSVAETRMEAIALGPAAVGGMLQARLTAGGKAVKVIAVGTGRAVLAPIVEVQP